MKWFYHLKIRTKLLSSFILVALIAGTVGLIGLSNIRKIDNADTMLYEKMTVPLNQLGEMSTTYQRARVNMRDSILATTSEEAKQFAEKSLQLAADTEKFGHEFEKRIVSKDMRQAYQEFQKADSGYDSIRERILSLAVAGKDAEAASYMRNQFSAAQAEQDAIDKMQEMKIADAKKTSDNNTSMANKAIATMIVFVIVAVALAIGLGVFIAKIISAPVIEIASAAEKVAEGDLTVNIDNDCKDEVGNLSRSFQQMILNLRRLVGGVADTSGAVASSSQELSATSEEVTKGIQQIAETVNQVAAGSQEQSKTVQNSAESMEQLSRAIGDVAAGAQNQARTVESTVALVQQITAAIEQVA
ncbi:MAG: methyl-accepting chemotaxis protein, partial [Armatimonadetes bacterium]|nr:methyl-accepting chemotaxis protein [Armatimonadota bacterium]